MAEDPLMILCRENVARAKTDTSGRVYRVYCDGIFDLAHVGHFNMLKQVKYSLGDPNKVFVLCGVCSDEDTKKFKGKVVMNHQLRVDTMEHCRWVDEVRPDAPWVITKEYMDKYQIDFVAHDALPYKDLSGQTEEGDVYLPIKKAGKFLETQRTEGVSTSDLIVSIIKDYDDYVQRNLNRGYSKEQLNVGRTWEMRAYAHEKEARMKDHLNLSASHFRDITAEVLAFLSELSTEIQSGGVSAIVNHPEHATGVIYHSLGLVRELAAASWFALSWMNPFAYCCRKAKYE